VAGKKKRPGRCRSAIPWKKIRSVKNLYPDNRPCSLNTEEKYIIFAAKNAVKHLEPNEEKINEVFY